MRTEFSKKISSVFLLCLLLCTILTLNVGAVDVNDETSITIKSLPETEGISLTIYEIADYINGDFILNNEFSKCNVDLNSIFNAEDSAMTTEKIGLFINSEGIKGSELKIGANGIAEFKNLTSDKLYFIMQTSTDELFKIQSMLVSVPYRNDEGLQYNINIDAKVFNKQQPTNPTTVLPTVKPTTPPTTPSTLPTNPPVATTTGNPVITGENFVVYSIILVAIISLGVACIVRKRKVN